MKKTCFIAILLFFIPFLAFSQPTALDIHKLGIITTPQVIEVYNKALQGDAYAQADIGQSLINGSIGVLPNYNRGLYWFRKSAKQGEPLAYLNLAMMYLSGNGIRKNDKKAIKYAKLGIKTYYEKIKKGEYDKYQKAEVEYQVANLYFWGVPPAVHQNLPKSFKMYYESANSGFVHSINKIIIMYRYGIGTKKDLPKAYQWILLLATAGDVHAQYMISLDYIKGLGVKKDTKQGTMWLRKAASAHYNPAVVTLYALSKQGLVKLTPAEEKTLKSIMESAGDNIIDLLSKEPQTKF